LPELGNALFDTEKIHKRGYYHDGRFSSLEAVVDHYHNNLKVKLTPHRSVN
jgi:cytochrome c peroxidase